MLDHSESVAYFLPCIFTMVSEFFTMKVLELCVSLSLKIEDR